MAYPTDRNITNVRKPAVAGRFYPADPGKLREMVQGFLVDARREIAPPDSSTTLLGVLAPHAGFVFSGFTAACAYATLEGRTYDTVILIGGPHTAAARTVGASVYRGSVFETPLGAVAVDTDLARRIVASSSAISEDEISHRQEHSLEVQLPFLQLALQDVAIVPILVAGQQTLLDEVAGAIVKAVSARGRPGRTLFVISTDLSHYPKQQDAEKYDSEILQAFCSLDGELLLAKDKQIMGLGVDNLACTMCGLRAAFVGIRIANKLGATTATLLDRRTSADAGVSGVSEREVVGYGAAMLTGAGSTRS